MGSYQEFDEFLRRASEDENLGNKNNWFFVFRKAMDGFHNRAEAVRMHDTLLHGWIPKKRGPEDSEYHISAMLFNMDSALECLTFALNSFGKVVNSQFFSISDKDNLKKVSPKNITQEFIYQSRKKHSDIFIGYKNLFPRLQEYWILKVEMQNIIIANHDVSKHRHSIYSSGLRNTSAPHNFYEQLGIKGVVQEEHLYWPMKEVILQKDPKETLDKQDPKNTILLEELTAIFFEFINESGKKIFQDMEDYFEKNPFKK